MSIASNLNSVINIEFFNKESCQISYDDLIIDFFSRANL